MAAVHKGGLLDTRRYVSNPHIALLWSSFFIRVPITPGLHVRLITGEPTRVLAWVLSMHIKAC